MPMPDQGRQVVVVGVDGSLEAAEAAQYAALAADARGLDRLVVHAFSLPPTARGSTRRLSSSADVGAQRVVEDALTQIRMPVGLHVHTEVEETEPGTLLLRLSYRAAIVVLGHHVFDIADQLVEGSVAGPLAAAPNCPVVVVPRGWGRIRRGPTVAVTPDRSSSAEAVLAFAFAEADRHQSPVVALHAAAQGVAVESAGAGVRNLEEILTAAKASHPDLLVSVTVVTGDVAQALLDASQGVR
jgi:nucleotide-binding universal stress UspA family protein